VHNEVVSGATQIPQLVLWIGAACFLFALIHIFSVGRIKHLAERYPTGSILENLFHFLSEVEVVFPIWAGIAVLFYSLLGGLEEARFYLESLSFSFNPPKGWTPSLTLLYMVLWIVSIPQFYAPLS